MAVPAQQLAGGAAAALAVVGPGGHDPFSGWVATVAGWYATEVGRQPFLVYGLLRTADATSAVPAPQIALTLALYLTVYIALIRAYVGVLEQARVVQWARIARAPMVGGLVLISMATPWISETVRGRRFVLPELIALSAIPLLIGVCISVPAIVAYTIFSDRVFRGKATELRYA